MHATETRCEPMGFNMYETVDVRTMPAISYTSGEPRYGAITSDVNAGLRLPQARPLSLETFNSGCVNPHGCVSNFEDGFKCPGPLKTTNAQLSTLFDDLYAPYAPDNFEMMSPPAYVVGIKSTGVNSVLGWQSASKGALEWQLDSSRMTCAQQSVDV